MGRLRKRRKTYTRAEQHLCDELLVEIFTRLPSKTLLRCRSLSKSWYSFISSPDFIRMHTLRSRQSLLIRHRSFKVNKRGEFEGFYTLHPEDQLPLCPALGYNDITQVQFPSTYSVISGSHNGIVCLFDYGENRISLWNPSIRRKLTLPDCPRKCYSGLEIAFGFDPVTDDYKIASIPGRNRENVETSYVYSMKTDAWCEIASPMPLFNIVTSKACCVSGVLHWAVQYVGRPRCFLLTFDLSTHVFGSIELPEPSWSTRGPLTIQGSLAVTCRYCPKDNWIWVRRDASWSLVYQLKTERELNGVLQQTCDGDLLFDTEYDGFHVYNPKIGESSKLADFSAASFLLEIVQCVESLQLLDIGTACR